MYSPILHIDFNVQFLHLESTYMYSYAVSIPLTWHAIEFILCHCSLWTLQQKAQQQHIKSQRAVHINDSPRVVR